MKPLVLKAQAKELYDSIKGVQEMSLDHLIDLNMKILKMQMEVSENLKKLGESE
jgi:hypothetical protein